MQAKRAPRVATIHDVTKETIRAHLTLVHVFHVYASVDTLWVAHALSRCTPVRYGRTASVSMTHDATQVGDSICPVFFGTFQILVQQGSTNTCLNRHRRGLPPLSSEFHISPLPFLPIQYSLFPLIAPPGLQLWHKVNIIKQNSIQGGCKVLALIEGERKVSFGQSWCALQSNGVRTYVV
jgi:hypothetical protein